MLMEKRSQETVWLEDQKTHSEGRHQHVRSPTCSCSALPPLSLAHPPHGRSWLCFSRGPGRREMWAGGTRLGGLYLRLTSTRPALVSSPAFQTELRDETFTLHMCLPANYSFSVSLDLADFSKKSAGLGSVPVWRNRADATCCDHSSQFYNSSNTREISICAHMKGLGGSSCEKGTFLPSRVSLGNGCFRSSFLSPSS